MFIDLIKKPIIAERRRRADQQLALAAPQVDAFLVSYPKSGRTWLRYLLSNYFATRAGIDFEIRLNNKFRILPNFDMTDDRGLPVFVGKRANLPLIAVSHRAYQAELFRDRPAILLLRDVRDVVVSAYFHQTRQKGRFSGTLAEFIEHSGLGVPAIVDYLNGWAEHLADRRALVLSYEEMQADTPRVLRRVVEFMGQEADDRLIDQAIAAGQFDRMQQQEKDRSIPGHSYDRNDGEALRMRKGKVGGYRDYLTESDVARIEQLCDAGLSPAARALLDNMRVQS